MAKLPKITKKGKLILQVLIDNPEGLRKETIKKLTNLKERTIYNHLEYLKKQKILENVYPIWRLCQNQVLVSKIATLLKSDKPIQGHKFSFHLKLINKPNWWNKRENRLLKLKEYNFKINKEVNWGNNPYEQLIKDNFLIHIFPDAIYFINQKKYFNLDPYLALQEALEDTLKLLDFLEERFKFKFFPNELPLFSVKTNHFVKLNDEIAKRCKKNKNLLEFYKEGIKRAWIDLSQPLGLETGSRNYGAEDMNNYKPYMDDFLFNKPLTNSELKEVVANNSNQLSFLIKDKEETRKELKEFAIALNRHIPAYEKMGKYAKQIGNAVDNLTKAITKKNIKSKDEVQKTISDY
jgi:hypothetical protein